MPLADETPVQGPPKRRPTEAEFARLLSKRIESAIHNPGELRKAIYELARIKLLEQFGRDEVAEVRPTMQTLEAAILQVEKAFDRKPREPVGPPKNAVPNMPLKTTEAIPPAPPVPIKPVRPTPPLVPDRSSETRRHASWAFVSKSVAFIFLAVLVCCGALVFRSHIEPDIRRILATSPFQPEKSPIKVARQDPVSEPDKPPSNETPNGQPSLPPDLPPRLPGIPSLPLPSMFGTYALNNSQLIELKQLPGKVPDHRVGVSAPITTPSQTTLPDGDVKFIVFRNDPEMKATDVVEVRIVAKVSRAMGVDSSGRATISPASESWVIRGTSLPFKIGPIENQPQMLLAEPETAGLVLEPGRYAFVIKGLGFDFTVAGEITNSDQCLERIDAANGAFYSPCPRRQLSNSGQGTTKGP